MLAGYSALYKSVLHRILADYFLLINPLPQRLIARKALLFLRNHVKDMNWEFDVPYLHKI
jgi:hypothetical protein